MDKPEERARKFYNHYHIPFKHQVCDKCLAVVKLTALLIQIQADARLELLEEIALNHVRCANCGRCLCQHEDKELKDISMTLVEYQRHIRALASVAQPVQEIECCSTCAGTDRAHFGIVMGTSSQRCTDKWHDKAAHPMTKERKT